VSAVQIKGGVLVVTGAGSGIGEATALLCAKTGAAVIAVDVDADAVEATAGACRALGVSAHA
jgi:NADP-dependent 3-hydroxy acid dehydrogenase YdfG